MPENKSGVDTTNTGTLDVSSAASLLGRLLNDDLDTFDGPTDEEQVDEPQPKKAKEKKQPPADEGDESEDEEDSAEREDSTEDEDSTDEDEVETEEDEQPDLHAVKIGGKEEKVTLDELKAGYSRQRDYTQKTQAHSAAVKQFETEKQTLNASVRADREQYAAKLTALDAAMKEATPAEPNWAEERKRLKPEEYNSLWVAWSEHKEQLKTVADAKAKADADVAKDRQKTAQEYVAGEHAKLIEAVPEWKDPAKQAVEMQKLVKFAIERLGFTRSDLETVTDARSVLLVRMAYRGEQLLARAKSAKSKAEKPETEVEAPKGGDQRPKKVNRTERAYKRLVKTGSVMDAAAAIETML